MIEQEAAAAEVKEIVDRETQAWDQQDLDKLMSVFHPDMVWPWARTSQSHDPIDWIFEVGRFNYERWPKGWAELFALHRLVHNIRKIRKIVVSKEAVTTTTYYYTIVHE
jgi:hypothetical protein